MLKVHKLTKDEIYYVIGYISLMPEILQRDAVVLRQTAKEVPIADIGTEKLNAIIADMRKAMASQKDGIAIAAPQIGISLRIFVVAGKLLKQADKTYKGDGSDLVFINPVLTKLSKEKKEVEEGCLSVRWLYGIVKRSTRVTINALNEKGEKIDRGASGLLGGRRRASCCFCMARRVNLSWRIRSRTRPSRFVASWVR